MALNLTRTEWKTFKVENNLDSGSFFKKANVGPLVDSFHEAGKRWEAKDGMTADGRKFLKVAEKLHKALAKFVRNKDTKGQLSREAYAQIRSWMEEVGETHDQLLDLMRMQKQTGCDRSRDAEILGKKLDKMFNF